MNLQDEHLRQALRHAPDRELSPPDITRNAVLDYAANAIQRPAEGWMQKWRCVLHPGHWSVVGWSLAGMGGAIAALLVVAVLWSERPDDPLRLASAPDADIQSKLETLNNQAPAGRSQAEPSQPAPPPTRVVVAAAESSSASKNQEKAAGNLAAKQALAKAENSPSVTPVAGPTDKLIVATAPEAPMTQELGRDADATVRLKERAVSGAVATPAPPRMANAERDDALAQPEAAGKMAPVEKSARAEAGRSEIQAKADLPSAAVGAKSAENCVVVLAIAKSGGAAMAKNDIQAGLLRLLDPGKLASTGAPVMDALTGYQIQGISGCDISEALQAEVAAYNQIMRDWRARNKSHDGLNPMNINH